MHQRGEVFEPGVVADQQHPGDVAVVVGDLHQHAGGGVVDALVLAQFDITQGGQGLLGGLAGAAGRRADHAVGQVAMVAQPAPGGLGLGLALQRKRPIEVFLAGSGRFGVGVAEQDQFAHGIPCQRR